MLITPADGQTFCSEYERLLQPFTFTSEGERSIIILTSDNVILPPCYLVHLMYTWKIKSGKIVDRTGGILSVKLDDKIVTLEHSRGLITRRQYIPLPSTSIGTLTMLAFLASIRNALTEMSTNDNLNRSMCVGSSITSIDISPLLTEFECTDGLVTVDVQLANYIISLPGIRLQTKGLTNSTIRGRYLVSSLALILTGHYSVEAMTDDHTVIRLKCVFYSLGYWNSCMAPHLTVSDRHKIDEGTLVEWGV